MLSIYAYMLTTAYDAALSVLLVIGMNSTLPLSLALSLILSTSMTSHTCKLELKSCQHHDWCYSVYVNKL
jgi:hypothetical protein